VLGERLSCPLLGERRDGADEGVEIGDVGVEGAGFDPFGKLGMALVFGIDMGGQELLIAPGAADVL
jgi:hypothetical protein